MRSLSVTERVIKSDQTEAKKQISTFYNTVATVDSPNIDENLKEKINTFTRWKVSSSLPKKLKKKNVEDFDFFKENTNALTPLQSLLSMIIKQNEEKLKNQKKGLVVEELEGVKTDRRQRFKRVQNPQEIIIHYVKNQGFKPSKQQQQLLYRVVKLKTKLDQIQPFNLQIALQHIIKSMNMAVDFNNTNFLINLIIMAADICFQAKQMKTSFFFLTQAIVAATCTKLWHIKLDGLICMGKICLEVGEAENSILFFKKALQYAWKLGDREIQLRLYDYIGKAYYYQGKCESALYYHNRYILGENTKKVSAVYRMSAELLKDYEKQLDYSESQNLSQLFLDYLRLPITNFKFYPPTEVDNPFPNYVENESPRKNRKDIEFRYQDLPDINVQIEKVLKQFSDFKSEIPSPDLYKNFVPSDKYSKNRKNQHFEQSRDYHNIFGVQIKKFDKSALKLPMDEKLAKIMDEKQKPDWWEQMLVKSKKERSQKIGGIRNKVYKMHLSLQQSEKAKIENKKRQAINQSFNKTLLNWIDPPVKTKRE